VAEQKAGWFEKTKIFFGEVRTELDKVSWPTQEQVKTYTAVVLASTAVIALVMGGWDMVLGWTVKTLFESL
jgi:preprotein translocase subunit SecE